MLACSAAIEPARCRALYVAGAECPPRTCLLWTNDLGIIKNNYASETEIEALSLFHETQKLSSCSINSLLILPLSSIRSCFLFLHTRFSQEREKIKEKKKSTRIIRLAALLPRTLKSAPVFSFLFFLLLRCHFPAPLSASDRCTCRREATSEHSVLQAPPLSVTHH